MDNRRNYGLDKQSLSRYNLCHILAASFLAVTNSLFWDRSEDGFFYILIYGVPFVLIVISLVIFWKRLKQKHSGYLFIVYFLISLWQAEPGNLSSATFLCMAIFCLDLKFGTIIGASLFFVSTGINVFIYQWGGAETIMHITIFLYIISIYHYILKPKNLIYNDEIKPETVQILNSIIVGKSRKEIAFNLDITQDAINKRLERARKGINARSIEELIIRAYKNGQIEQ